MPQFLDPVPASEIEKAKPRVDLSAYTDYLKSVEAGKIGKVALSEEEKKITIKNRLSRAAEMVGREIKFRRSPGAEVMFEVLAVAQDETASDETDSAVQEPESKSRRRREASVEVDTPEVQA